MCSQVMCSSKVSAAVTATATATDNSNRLHFGLPEAAEAADKPAGDEPTQDPEAGKWG